MPIKGLTDRKTPSFPKIGDIRKGAKKTDPKRPGEDLTYFRYVSLEGEEAAAEKFHQIYGDEPREINVFLPFDSIERNFEAFMERHTASALQCRGDGETAFLWRDAKSGVMQYTPKPCPLPHCTGCKEVGRLKIIVPELQRLAYVTVHTTSKWDIIELTANLEAIRRLTGNGLKGIPLILKRRPRTVSTPRAKGKRVRQEKWLLSIEADPRWVKAQLEAMRIAALPAQIGQPTSPQEEGEIVESEWDGELGASVDSETGEVIEGQFAPASVPSSPSLKPPPARAELEERWENLWQEAISLNLNPESLPTISPDNTDAELIAAGKKLAAIVETAKPEKIWDAQVIATVLQAELSENSYSAVGALKKSDLSPDTPADVVVAWFRQYRASRDAEGSSDEAATVANTWLAGEVD